MTALLVFITVFSVQAISKNELITQCEKNSLPFKFGVTARFISKVNIQNNTISDSGKFYFLPPNYSRVDFIASRMTTSTCGDTTWTKMATGDITRSLSSNSGLTGVPSGGATSMSSPNLLFLLNKGDFSIISADSTAIVITMPIENGKQKLPFTFYIDPKTYVINRMEFPSPMAGMFQINYKYRLFKGRLVVEEVNVVMGNIGYSTVKLLDYQKFKQKKTFFQIF